MRRRQPMFLLCTLLILTALAGCEESNSAQRPVVPESFSAFSPSSKSDVITDYFMVEKSPLSVGTLLSDTTSPSSPMHGHRITVANDSSLSITVTADYYGYAALYQLQDDGSWGDNLVMRWIEPEGETFSAMLSYTATTGGTFLVVVGSPWSFSYAYSVTAACSGTCVVTGCAYNGSTVSVGESVPSEDGCNTCTCNEFGKFSCTEIACAPLCEDTDSKTYTFKSLSKCYAATFSCQAGEKRFDDDCGCGCEKQGSSCSDETSNFNKRYFSNDLAKCTAVNFNCPENTSYFGNECGCGCEQSAECPPVINCMPPVSADSPCNSLSDLEAKCPFTEVLN